MAWRLQIPLALRGALGRFPERKWYVLSIIMNDSLDILVVERIYRRVRQIGWGSIVKVSTKGKKVLNATAYILK